MSRRRPGLTLLAGCLALAASQDARAQGWSIDFSAGRTTYDAVAANVGANNLAATIRFDTRSDDWIYAAAAMPMSSGDPFWGATGGGGRLEARSVRHVSLGIDAAAHGFLFRDRVVEQNGQGATLEAIPFAAVTTGPARFEVRGGWRGQALSYSGTTQTRGVLETGARLTYETADVRLRAESRWVRATEGTFPFVGGSAMYGASSRVQLWAHAGQWVGDELNDVVWGTGVGVAAGATSLVWATVQQEASDPLYWNAPRWSWTVGVTHRLGGAPAPPAPLVRASDGSVVIRLDQALAPAGPLSIAGDFNNWRPARMHREGEAWVFRVQLAPGVYNYAFRSESGTWFVPESIPGRRDDGMGGHVAVLVVS